MIFYSPRQIRRAFCAVCCIACLAFAPAARPQNFSGQSAPPAQDSAKTIHRAGPTAAHPPASSSQTTAALDGLVRDAGLRHSAFCPLAGCRRYAAQRAIRPNLQRRNFSRRRLPGFFSAARRATTNCALKPKITPRFVLPDLALQANEVVTLEISLVTRRRHGSAASRLPRLPRTWSPRFPAEAQPSFGRASRVFATASIPIPSTSKIFRRTRLPPVADVYNTVSKPLGPLEQPDYRRYSQRGEYVLHQTPLVRPFSTANRLKGDEPIWPERFGQQVFLNITASSGDFFLIAAAFRSSQQRQQSASWQPRFLWQGRASPSSIKRFVSRLIYFTATAGLQARGLAHPRHAGAQP